MFWRVEFRALSLSIPGGDEVKWEISSTFQVLSCVQRRVQRRRIVLWKALLVKVRSADFQSADVTITAMISYYFRVILTRAT